MPVQGRVLDVQPLNMAAGVAQKITISGYALCSLDVYTVIDATASTCGSTTVSSMSLTNPTNSSSTLLLFPVMPLFSGTFQVCVSYSGVLAAVAVGNVMLVSREFHM